MHKLVKISEAASLALHTMGYIAAAPAETFTTGDIAQHLGASAHHLAKVMHQLSKAGLLNSRRGPGGGFSLARPAEEITLLEVYQATEGPVQASGCLLNQPVCPGVCLLGYVFDDLGQKLQEHLATTYLSDLNWNCPKEVSHATGA